MAMISIMGPRRPDLSGRPIGFLIMWRPQEYPLKWQPEFEAPGTDGLPVKYGGYWYPDAPSRFAPIRCSWSLGVCWYPWWEHSGWAPRLPCVKFAIGHPA